MCLFIYVAYHLYYICSLPCVSHLLLNIKFRQQMMIGISQLRVEKAFDVYEGSRCAGMAQSLGDKFYIEVVLICQACPRVAHHIRGEWLARLDALGEDAQIVVVQAQLTLVLPVSQSVILFCNNREHVVGVNVGVLHHNLGHTGFYRHDNLLSGLVAGILELSILDL